jgi:hypothetical protein
MFAALAFPGLHQLEEQKRSGFHYQYSNYQVEYSCNLIFSSGREMDEVFQALIDRSRVLLDIQKVKTILGSHRRPKFHWRKNNSAQWEVAVEKPAHDLTIFKVHCGKLTLKIYTKGERLLRKIPDPSIGTTKPFTWPCKASLMSSGWPPKHQQ